MARVAPVEDIVEILGEPGFGVSRDGRVWTRWNGRLDYPFHRRLWVLDEVWRDMTPIPKSRTLYLQVKLWTRHAYVHRLVLETFIGACPSGMEACHNDSNTMNNSLSNLRWDTPVSNQQDRITRGNGPGVQTHEFVKWIRELYEAGHSIRSIARISSTDRNAVKRIVKRETYKHVE